MTLQLTEAEIEGYMPYHTFPEFRIAFDAYVAGCRYEGDPNGVGGQAADRGDVQGARRGGVRAAPFAAAKEAASPDGIQHGAAQVCCLRPRLPIDVRPIRVSNRA